MTNAQRKLQEARDRQEKRRLAIAVAARNAIEGPYGPPDWQTGVICALLAVSSAGIVIASFTALLKWLLR
jgi:hypothetical protein